MMTDHLGTANIFTTHGQFTSSLSDDENDGYTPNRWVGIIFGQLIRSACRYASYEERNGQYFVKSKCIGPRL
jgi:hypothetical protein